MLLFKSHLKLPLIDTFSTECLVSFREWARDKISNVGGAHKLYEIVRAYNGTHHMAQNEPLITHLT